MSTFLVNTLEFHPETSLFFPKMSLFFPKTSLFFPKTSLFFPKMLLIAQKMLTFNYGQWCNFAVDNALPLEEFYNVNNVDKSTSIITPYRGTSPRLL